MDIVTRLTDEMKTAMKSGQKDRLQVVRMLLNEARNADLQPGKPTSISMVEAYGKKLKKSIEEWEKLGKADEVAKLHAELAIVAEFLPSKLGAEATAKLVDEFLSSHPFTGQQVGQAMGAFMKAHGADVDAAIVSPMIKQRLAGK